MYDAISYFKWLVSVLLGYLIVWLGGLDAILRILIFLLCIDYIAGILKAVYTKQLDSSIDAKGIARKVYKCILVAIASIIDGLLAQPFGLREAVIMFLIINEIISIIENAGVLGLKYPVKMQQVLKQLKNHIETESEDKKDER